MLRVSAGDYAGAQCCAEQGLELAEELANRQWLVAAHLVLGVMYRELFAPETATQHLACALGSADETGAPFWTRLVLVQVTRAHLEQGELARADTLLGRELTGDSPMHTSRQRWLWSVRAELALAQGDAARALEITDRLIASAPNPGPERVIPYLWKLRGEALMALGRSEEAAADGT